MLKGFVLFSATGQKHTPTAPPKSDTLKVFSITVANHSVALTDDIALKIPQSREDLHSGTRMNTINNATTPKSQSASTQTDLKLSHKPTSNETNFNRLKPTISHIVINIHTDHPHLNVSLHGNNSKLSSNDEDSEFVRPTSSSSTLTHSFSSTTINSSYSSSSYQSIIPSRLLHPNTSMVHTKINFHPPRTIPKLTVISTFHKPDIITYNSTTPHPVTIISRSPTNQLTNHSEERVTNGRNLTNVLIAQATRSTERNFSDELTNQKEESGGSGGYASETLNSGTLSEQLFPNVHFENTTVFTKTESMSKSQNSATDVSEIENLTLRNLSNSDVTVTLPEAKALDDLQETITEQSHVDLKESNYPSNRTDANTLTNDEPLTTYPTEFQSTTRMTILESNEIVPTTSKSNPTQTIRTDNIHGVFGDATSYSDRMRTEIGNAIASTNENPTPTIDTGSLMSSYHTVTNSTRTFFTDDIEEVFSEDTPSLDVKGSASETFHASSTSLNTVSTSMLSSHQSTTRISKGTSLSHGIQTTPFQASRTNFITSAQIFTDFPRSSAKDIPARPTLKTSSFQTSVSRNDSNKSIQTHYSTKPTMTTLPLKSILQQATTINQYTSWSIEMNGTDPNKPNTTEYPAEFQPSTTVSPHSDLEPFTRTKNFNALFESESSETGQSTTASRLRGADVDTTLRFFTEIGQDILSSTLAVPYQKTSDSITVATPFETTSEQNDFTKPASSVININYAQIEEAVSNPYLVPDPETTTGDYVSMQGIKSKITTMQNDDTLQTTILSNNRFAPLPEIPSSTQKTSINSQISTAISKFLLSENKVAIKTTASSDSGFALTPDKSVPNQQTSIPTYWLRSTTSDPIKYELRSYPSTSIMPLQYVSLTESQPMFSSEEFNFDTNIIFQPVPTKPSYDFDEETSHAFDEPDKYSQPVTDATHTPHIDADISKFSTHVFGHNSDYITDHSVLNDAMNNTQPIPGKAKI